MLSTIRRSAARGKPLAGPNICRFLFFFGRRRSYLGETTCCVVPERRSSVAMTVTARNMAPRAVGGGRSLRYDERRLARGGTARHAPVWTDSAAAAVLAQLHKDHAAGDMRAFTEHCLLMLCDSAACDRMLARCGKGVSLNDRAVAAAVVHAHSRTVRGALWSKGRKAALARVHSFLKPLRERGALTQTVAELVVPPVVNDGPATFASWLAPPGEH